MRAPIPLFLCCTTVVACAAPLRAQAPDSAGPLRSAVSATKPMTRIRVELEGGRRVTGTLLDAGTTALTLETDSGMRLAVPYAGVTRYWDRRRAVAAGAVTGGILGAGTGAFLGMLAVGLCEYDCHGTIAGGAVVGGLIVGAAGALAGGVVGAAIPRWSERWRVGTREGATRAAPPPVTAEPTGSGGAPAPPRTREIGEVTLFGLGGYGGYTTSPVTGDDTRGLVGGASAGLAFRMRQVTFGPDLGFLGGASQVMQAQWIFRLDLADRRRPGVVPYAVAGAGAHMWSEESEEFSYFTGSFGAGLTFGARHQWRAEARWNPVLQYSSSGPHPTLITAAVGHRFSW